MDLKWIACANELNAAYAADGYARTKGVGVVVSTYGAGETCTWGGLAGAHAENSKVVSLVGMPGIAEWKTGTRSHHMIADQPPEYDLFAKMVKEMSEGQVSSQVTCFGFFAQPSGNKEDKITYTPLFERIQAFLKPNDILVADASMSAICGSAKMKLPDGVDLEAQTSWGAIGWGTPAILGHCVAAPDRRCIILAGEGGHQMTANNMGSFYRYGLKPVFLMVNNGGYLAERVTNRHPDEEYNDVPDWNFVDIPKAMGCQDWFTVKVSTLDELDSALAKAEKADCGVYIEILIDKFDIPSGGDFVFKVTGPAFGMPNRSWSGWKEKHLTEKS